MKRRYWIVWEPGRAEGHIYENYSEVQIAVKYSSDTYVEEVEL